MAKKKVLSVLSLDPGAKNFAYSINKHELKGNKVVSVVEKTGVLDNSIKEVKANLKTSTNLFLEEINVLRDSNNVSLVIAERFMSRGHTVGITGEVVGIMLGALILNTITEYPNCKIKLISSSLWKNAFNRMRVFDDKNNNWMKESYRLCAATPHEMDATLIGIWGAYDYFGIKPFQDYGTIKARDKLLFDIEQASTQKLRNIKFQRKFYKWKK